MATTIISKAERREAVIQGLCDALPAAGVSGPENHMRIHLGGVTVCLMTIAERIIERLDEQVAER
jgi:hypothetical protein